MPAKRPVRKGSFGGHFDELVKHFPDEQRPKPGEPPGKPKLDAKDIHDRLFESTWRHAREGRRPTH